MIKDKEVEISRNASVCFNHLEGKQKLFIGSLILGFGVTEACRITKVDFKTLGKWRKFVEGFRYLEDHMELLREEITVEVTQYYTHLIGLKSLVVLNDLIDSFRKIGYDKLDKDQLKTLVSLITMAVKLGSNKVSELPMGYEEELLRRRRVTRPEAKTEVKQVE